MGLTLTSDARIREAAGSLDQVADDQERTLAASSSSAFSIDRRSLPTRLSGAPIFLLRFFAACISSWS
jgi:hypothetical protein